MTSNRNIHRSLGYLISLPILMFSISGTYHLLQYAYGDHHRGLKLGAPKLYDADQFSTDFEWLKPYQSQSLNGLSIIHGPNAERLYRLSFPNRLSNSAAGEKVKISHAERFKGVPAEQRALYINTLTGVASEYTDRDIAMHYAHEWSTIEAEHIESVELITRFGPAYDFRNKRLPVWRIAYTHHDESKQLFIDPVTGMLVDQTSKAERLEGLSFSFLHKWNFLTPIMGRQNRDIIISLILSIAILSTLLGYWLLLKRQKKRKRLFAPIPSLSQIK